MAKKAPAENTFSYLPRIKYMLIAITALLTLLIPISFLDSAAWIGRVPVISLLLLPIVLAFIWVIWQDSGQTVTLTKAGLRWDTGAGRFKKSVFLPWDEIGQLRDNTTIFSISRKYTLVSAADPDVRIQINSALSGYRELLGHILKRIPASGIHARAKTSLQRMHLYKG